ncbi:GDSL esterase/lipase EXL3-like [Rutidosis leptorrhynchoides]|uniref:GDSL esterase/lipase EXL3-like n=1 Tax=Rutidosis leptorrhynchoides TaxID=125765 RepID=UPI003A990ED4
MVFCFATLLQLLLVLVSSSESRNVTFPAIIVFGDSIVDPGNNNNLKTIAKCNFPPYGRDFAGAKPTGRFCNGKIAPDFIAETYGIKELIPPYLDPSLKMGDLLTGVSFASGGAGYDPITSEFAPAISLSGQLDLFKEYISKIKSGAGEEKAANILSNGFFVVVVGSNDISNTYYGTPIRSSHYDVNSYTDLTTSYAYTFLQELYGLGARKIGVLGAPPIGCVPSQRTLYGSIERGCSDKENKFAVLFNSKLYSVIDRLNRHFSGSKFVYIDIYYSLLAIIQNPAHYGFEVATKGCCGTGDIEVSVLCNSLRAPYSCQDATKYVFWDSFHPTERTYQIIARQVLQKYQSKFF